MLWGLGIAVESGHTLKKSIPWRHVCSGEAGGLRTRVMGVTVTSASGNGVTLRVGDTHVARVRDVVVPVLFHTVLGSTITLFLYF